MCPFMLELDLLEEDTGSIKLKKRGVRAEGMNERRNKVWFKQPISWNAMV